RVLRTPIPWPGPSTPGGSIADPLRVGLWQDGEDVEHTLVGHHLQIMGKSGSGKSEGAAWNYLAEITSRADTVVIAADITKRDQFLGPLRPALHRFETTRAGVRAMMADLHRAMGARMDYLAKKGLTKWEPGCGLSYLVVWIEEFPDVGDAIDMTQFLSVVKALRSGGGSIVLSLQRSDYSQMPTLARGQLAKMCFAVDSDADAEFGLSERQDDNPAVRPELWATCGPDTVGMAYLDAPSIPTERAGMALRTFHWKSNTAAVAAHAEAFSTDARPADPVTARHLLSGDTSADPARETVAGTADENHDQEDGELGGDLDGDPIAQHVRSADPNPDIVAGPDDAIDDTGYDGWTFDGPPRTQPMPTEEARALLEGQLSQWFRADRTHFRAGDLRPVWETAGRGRAWSGRYLREVLLPAGVIAEDDERGGYVIVRDPADERELVSA
ncbi:MAG UNVERIFIED_CONTAM: type IV secretory system conjugative DNA transfer family protein, partial [Thermobifida fusca]